MTYETPPISTALPQAWPPMCTPRTALAAGEHRLMKSGTGDSQMDAGMPRRATPNPRRTRRDTDDGDVSHHEGVDNDTDPGEVEKSVAKQVQ